MEEEKQEYTENIVVEKNKKGFGITSMVLGIISILFCWSWLLGGTLEILAVVFGIFGIIKNRGKGMAIAGLTCGTVALFITAICLIPEPTTARKEYSVPTILNQINNEVKQQDGQENIKTNSNIVNEKNSSTKQSTNTSTNNTETVEEKKDESSINNNLSNEISNVTASQRNALSRAKTYLSHSAFSYQGLIEQLEFEKFSHEDSVYAVDNCGANWDEQAIKKAKSYLNFSAFSYKGLIEQLEFENFTNTQAKYGVDNCGADWNEQASKKAKSYLSYSAFSRDGLIDQLEFEGFTHEQAVYGVEVNGL